MKQYLVATIISLLTSNAFSEVVTAPTDQRVNPKVLAHQATLVPGLKKLGSRVFGAEFMGYSNFGFVETDNGVIVVDAGWFPTPTANAYALLREQTDKPVIAVIYTHLHMDHYGGIQAILPGNNPGSIPIYGPADWEDTVAMGQSVTHKATLRRAFMQMGIPIPEGLEGTVGNGIGPSPRLERNDALTYPPHGRGFRKISAKHRWGRSRALPCRGRRARALVGMATGRSNLVQRRFTSTRSIPGCRDGSLRNGQRP